MAKILQRIGYHLVLLCAVGCLSSCDYPSQVNFFATADYPDKLSAWGLLTVDRGTVVLGRDNVVYDLTSPLFTDYALKLRTLYLPPGSTLQYKAFDSFEAPSGTIISKTFFYPVDAQGNIDLQGKFDGQPAHIDLTQNRLMETRLLVKQDNGWEALPYIWRGDDAHLSITGDLITLQSIDQAINYVVPSRNQCASCHATNHTTAKLQPIGLKARYLNRNHPINAQNQLTWLTSLDKLENLPQLDSVTANGSLESLTADNLDHVARSYLDINCGHCHNPVGAADTSGLMLDYQDHDMRKLGACKPPIAAGRGSGGHLYSIVPGAADQSILAFRMATTDPGSMMPELGRSLVHKQGLSLISRWIDSLEGQCI